MRRAAVVLALGAAWSSVACSKSAPNSVVVVTVRANAAVPAVMQLQVDLANAGANDRELFPPAPAAVPIDFTNARFALTLPLKRSGTLDITVTGLSAQAVPVAVGHDQVDIVVGGVANKTITLNSIPVTDGGLAETGPGPLDTGGAVEVESREAGNRDLQIPGDAPGAGGTSGQDGGQDIGQESGGAPLDAIVADVPLVTDTPGAGGRGGAGGGGGSGGVVATGGVSATGGVATTGGAAGGGGGTASTGGVSGAGGTRVVDAALPDAPAADVGAGIDTAGPCSAWCTGTCIAAGCMTTLATNQTNAFSLAVDATSVYFTNLYVSVLKVALTGGAPVGLVTGLGYPARLAIDGTYVYWSHNSSGGNVYRTPLVGGGSVSLAGGIDYPGAIAVNASYVYFGHANGGLGAVMRVVPAGGTPEPIASGQGEPNDIKLDAANVYWVTRGNMVMRATLTGGSPTPLATVASAPANLAVDASYVYFTMPNDGTVMKVAIGGGTPAPLATGQGDPSGITVDDRFVYFTAKDAGTVMKVPLAGGAPVPLATGMSSPNHIVVDATSAYWTNGGGTVVRLTPK